MVVLERYIEIHYDGGCVTPEAKFANLIVNFLQGSDGVSIISLGEDLLYLGKEADCCVSQLTLKFHMDGVVFGILKTRSESVCGSSARPYSCILTISREHLTSFIEALTLLNSKSAQLPHVHVSQLRTFFRRARV